MQRTFEILYYVLFYPTLALAAYYSFLAIVALVSHKQKYKMSDDEKKFCIFVPCHNEGSVIAATVNNLSQIEYEERLHDIYFIADNCTDNTAEEISKAIIGSGKRNLHLLVRLETDRKKRGKPHAMRWGIEKLESEGGFYSKYDFFMVFDADNFTDADILKHINSQYLSYPDKKRPAMIQAYLDSKNKNNLIARGYYVSYRMTNGFLQLPRHKLGLTPAIGGTGFAVTTEFLRSIGGYNCKSLVEDLEFETVATIKGRTIAYNHNARIYDEKPTGLKESAVQKTRWCQGHWYIFFKYSWRLVLKMLNPAEFRLFFKRLDNLVHISSLVFMLFAMATIALPFVAAVFGVALPTSSLVYLSAPLFFFSVLVFPISSLLDGKQNERRRVLIDLIPNLIATAIMMLVYFYSNIVGLFNCKNQTVWKKTTHKITKLEEDKSKLQAKRRMR